MERGHKKIMKQRQKGGNEELMSSLLSSVASAGGATCWRCDKAKQNIRCGGGVNTLWRLRAEKACKLKERIGNGRRKVRHRGGTGGTSNGLPLCFADKLLNNHSARERERGRGMVGKEKKGEERGENPCGEV